MSVDQKKVIMNLFRKLMDTAELVTNQRLDFLECNSYHINSRFCILLKPSISSNKASKIFESLYLFKPVPLSI